MPSSCRHSRVGGNPVFVGEWGRFPLSRESMWRVWMGDGRRPVWGACEPDWIHPPYAGAAMGPRLRRLPAVSAAT